MTSSMEMSSIDKNGLIEAEEEERNHEEKRNGCRWRNCYCVKLFRERPQVAYAATFIVGVLTLAFGFACAYAIVPAVVDVLLRKELNIWDPETEGGKNFVRRKSKLNAI